MGEIWGRFRGDAWETASGAALSCLTLARALTRVRTRALIRGKHIAKNESMVEACVEVLGTSADQAATTSRSLTLRAEVLRGS